MKPWLSLVRRASHAGAAGYLLVTLLAFVPRFPFTLVEHFRVQLIAAGAIALAVTAALRALPAADLVALALLGNAVPVAGDAHARPAPMPATGTPLRFLALNVLTENADFAAVRALIADERPELIGLVEVDRRWLDALAPALADYTARIEQPRDDHLGLALYVRGGTLAGRAMDLGGGVPSIVADVTHGAARFAIILQHPIPPLSSEHLAAQRRQFAAIADRARTHGTPVLVAGDFNATPWSADFRALQRRGHLCDSRAGFGLQTTYRAGARLLRIPIDHVLASCSVGVRDRRIGPPVGSDHLPVIVDLLLPHLGATSRK